MACSGAYADANDFAAFWSVDVCNDMEAQLNQFLKMSAASIHAARAASNACDCDLAPFAEDLLGMLNVVLAAVMYQSSCGPNLTDDQRATYLEWTNTQLDMIRTGKLELCDGETGSDFPAITWAEQAFTEFAAGQILINRSRRGL